MVTTNAVRKRTTLRRRLNRLAYISGLVLVLLYLAGVAAGYGWLRYGRHIDQINVLDVALFRMGSIRRGIAAQHFIRAQEEWDAKKYQAAHLSFTSGMSNDPDNIAGRLAAARFLQAVGATSLGLSRLQDGLARAPADSRLIEATFEAMFAQGQDRPVLDLLRRQYGSAFSGPSALLLRTYEIRATHNSAGVAAARKLLENHAELLTHAPAAPVVAKVLWESAERLRALDLLAQYLRTQPAVYDDYAQLARWQMAGGQPAAAVQTAEQAGARFPDDTAAQVLWLEMRAGAASDGQPAAVDIEHFLRKFAGQPEPLALLATLAGRKGWVDLARTLYALAANGQPDLGSFALSYADALARTDKVADCQDLLTQIEAQVAEGSTVFLIQLRLRQVITAAALGDSNNLQELARQFAWALRNNPKGVESYRRYFENLGLTAVVEELAPRATGSKTPTPAVPLSK